MLSIMGGDKTSTFNFLVVITAALGSFSFGFNTNVTGSVLGMPSFYEYFNLNIEVTTGVIGGKNRGQSKYSHEPNLSLFAGIPGCFFGGGIIGAMIGAWGCEKFGRRRALFVASLIGVIGGIILGAAVNMAMILIGRALCGIS